LIDQRRRVSLAAAFSLEDRMRALGMALALAACAPAADQPAEAPAAKQQEATALETQPQSAEANLAAMPSWEGARAAGVDFRGVGQEPGWLIDIHRQDRIVLLLDYGESLTEFPLPAPSAPQEGVTRYETQAHGKSLTVTIRRTPCQDGMSGETYPARVEIVIDGRALNGCGRSV
jgi:putative lipoprotein